MDCAVCPEVTLHHLLQLQQCLTLECVPSIFPDAVALHSSSAILPTCRAPVPKDLGHERSGEPKGDSHEREPLIRVGHWFPWLVARLAADMVNGGTLTCYTPQRA